MNKIVSKGLKGVIVFILTALLIYLLYIIIGLYYFSLCEPTYETLYNIQINGNTPIEIRKDTSPLSKDAIVILKGDTSVKFYDYGLCEIDKITIQETVLNIYIKGRGDTLFNDTICIE